MENTRLGIRIKSLREKNNMRQEDLAKQLNVSISAVSKWENNKNVPDISTLQKMTQIFHVSLENLCCTEQTLEQLNNNLDLTISSEMVVSKSQIKKLLKHKSIIVVILIIIILIFLTIMIYMISDKQDDLSIRPYCYRTSEDEIWGVVYEMGCIYRGDLKEISNSHPYILLLSDDWIKNTDITADIHIMKLSFYKSEDDTKNWPTPEKVIYLYR